MADAKAKHERERHKERMAIAWHTAALGRMKDFPRDLAKWLDPPKPPTAEEIAALKRRISDLPQRLP